MRSARAAGLYLVLTAACIAYELSIRLYNRGNSEFAGMLSALVTLPSSLVMFALTPRIFGVRVGDSDTAFVTILGAAALLNASVLFFLLHRRTSKE
jgi:hypothetical protein